MRAARRNRPGNSSYTEHRHPYPAYGLVFGAEGGLRPQRSRQITPAHNPAANAERNAPIVAAGSDEVS